jgi:uncharacterized protein YggE
MKKTFLPLFYLAILVVLVTGCTSVLSASNNAPVRTINVNGKGTVKLEPDIAQINIGVRSESPDAGEALEQNNASALAVINVLTDMGVAREDIQTRNFNIYAQQDLRPFIEEPTEEEVLEEVAANENTGQTYVVENTVFVILRDLDTLGDILTAVVDQGANTIYGISFDIEDREAAAEEARKLAIQDAKAQAEAIAEAAGVKLGTIQSIYIESLAGMEPRVEYAAEAPQESASVPISSGTLTIQINANLTYEIK